MGGGSGVGKESPNGRDLTVLGSRASSPSRKLQLGEASGAEAWLGIKTATLGVSAMTRIAPS
jgi:hypothetical protein